MRPVPFRLTLVVLVLIAAAGMSATAARHPAQRDLTMTAPPRDATPTPSPVRRAQPPTVIVPNQFFEGNYFGEPVEFILNAELGQFFMLELTTEDFDAVLHINDEAGTQVARDDDSGPANMPLLLFVAPSTGRFTVVVSGFSDPVEGSYILRAGTAIERLPIGGTVTVMFDGTRNYLYAFEGERGDVLNIVASSRDTVDTTLRLVGPTNEQLAYVDDFSGYDPELRQIELNVSGTHFIVHAPYSANVSGEVSLAIKRTELASLTSQPQRFTIPQAQPREIFNVEVAAGALYIVTLSSNGEISGSIEVADMDAVSSGSVSFNTAEGASLFFRARGSGVLRVSVNVSNSAGEPETDIFLNMRAIDE